MITELNHVAILVRDRDESVEFYTTVLGGTVAWTARVESIGLDIVYVQVAGGFIELLHMPQVTAERPVGIDHIAFLSDDLDGDYAALIAAGHVSQSAPATAGSGVGRTAFVADPSGARVELLQRDAPVRDRTLTHPIIRAIDHVAVHAEDLHASLGFYAATLGLDRLRTIEIPGSDFAISYVGVGGDMVELHADDEPVGPSGFQHIALRVDDVDAALQQLGVSPVGAGARNRQGGPGRIAEFSDPNGVIFELLS
ncbi:VOC family protein [Salinibacterium sp. ZJ454]|uniref:VOC family protein n=1 Tax=Salinibacterium sp. ZJ454 TaxID=2708339 RepID=UPI00141D9688|nr:VOC family protein [Salinibacterium sp. ZJ454]